MRILLVLLSALGICVALANEVDSQTPIKLQPQIRSTPISKTRATIPYEDLKPFINEVAVIDEQQLSTLAQVLHARDEQSTVGAGGEIYVTGLPATLSKNYGIFRRNRDYSDPKTKHSLGIEMKKIGEAQLETKGEPAVLLVTAASEEVKPGDKLVALNPQSAEQLTLELKPPTQAVQGHILSLLNDGSIAGQYQVVVVDQGSEHGLCIGNVLGIFQPGAEVREPGAHSWLSWSRHKTTQLPAQEIGSLMLFKIYPKLSYGLIMEASKPVELKDYVSNPTS